jgi:glycerophosphoryl diester phosphodiesterase
MCFLKYVLLTIAVLIVVVIILDLLPVAPSYKRENPWRKAEGKAPLVIPHGGAKHLYPENTIYSYEMLSRDGYDVFEVDLCLTADDQLITHHDIDILGTTGIPGVNVIDKTYQELLQLNFGVNFVSIDQGAPYADLADHLAKGLVPATLSYLFENFPEKLYILEIKDTAANSGEEVFARAVDVLIQTIEEYNMQDRVIMASFDDNVVSYFRERTEEQIMTGSGMFRSIVFTVMSTLKVDFFFKPVDAALFLPIRDEIKEPHLSTVKRVPGFLRNKFFVYDAEEDKFYTAVAKKGIVRDAHRHNMAVSYWTVNDEETMRQLIEMNVDGIITDRPDLLMEVLKDMGYGAKAVRQ